MNNEQHPNETIATTTTHDNNVKAIISAFLGALSVLFLLFIVFIGMILGFLSILFGIIALVEMKTTKQYGKGMAITGIVLSSITIGLPLLVIAFAAFVL
ncbi:hypothetical protein CR194_05955 [Salipaludibacillus keqinensis]|uniref:DUF4190 domain-containing protein n=1 Tax=Salipaludibacillus keqinensis TaxID=2045207 RepID=A0A323TN14_9BACI|nr:DUF4190 domain-containing protein [Salipaludibacillus keqinensis]PYZ95057.1 hypothetical protein CR194_05955 [Salipaludibacillus keqinensis]